VIKRSAAWIFVALVVAYFAPALTTRTLFAADLQVHFFPIRNYIHEVYRAGHLPLWNPLIQGGMPLLADPNNLALYPTILLWFLLPPVAAFNLEIVLHVVLGGIGAYLLARELRLSQCAAFVAATIFALCGFTLSLVSMENRLFAQAWIPFVLLFVIRQRFAAAAIAGAVQALAGAPEACVLTWLAAFVWIAASRREQLLKTIAAAALAVFIAAIQIVPALALVSQSARGRGVAQTNFWEYSLHPKRMLQFVAPIEWQDEEGSPYIASITFGIAACVLVLASLRARTLEPRVKVVLAGILAVSLFFALGRYVFGTPAPPPLVRAFRFPIKMLTLTPLLVGLLAASAVDALPKKWRIVACVVVAAELMFVNFHLNPTAPRALFTSEPPLARAVREHRNGGRLYSEVQHVANPFAKFARLEEYTAAAYHIPVIFHIELEELEPIATMTARDLTAKVPWPAKANVLRAAGVSMVVSDAPHPELRPIATSAGATAYALDAQRPVVAYAVDYESSLTTAVQKIASGAADHVIFARGVPPPRGGAFSIDTRGDTAWHVNSTAPGFFIMNIPFDRDWRATIDGHDATLIPADLASSALVINSGAHDVALRYAPRSWWIGLLISIVGVLAAILLHCRVPKMRSPSNS